MQHQNQPDISHEDTIKALAAAIDTPVFEAVLGLIERHRQEWRFDAYGVRSDHAILAGHVTADLALENLRREMVELRAQGRSGSF